MRTALFRPAIGAVLFAMAAGFAAANESAQSPAYTVLDDDATQLREDFNRAQGAVRLLFVVDPICPACLRGLADLDEALLAKLRDPRVQTFVVHVPVIGARAQDVAPSARLLHNPNVRHYWNPSGVFGRELARAVDLRRGDELVYAWDVWLVYGPDAAWNGRELPQPHLLMHQLPALRGVERFPRLDRQALAREVHALLSRMDGKPALPQG